MLKSKHLYSPSNVFIISKRAFPGLIDYIFIPRLAQCYFSPCQAYLSLQNEPFLTSFLRCLSLVSQGCLYSSCQTSLSLQKEHFVALFARCLVHISQDAYSLSRQSVCGQNDHFLALFMDIYPSSRKMFITRLAKRIYSYRRFLASFARCLSFTLRDVYSPHHRTCLPLQKRPLIALRDVYPLIHGMFIPRLAICGFLILVRCLFLAPQLSSSIAIRTHPLEANL